MEIDSSVTFDSIGGGKVRRGFRRELMGREYEGRGRRGVGWGSGRVGVGGGGGELRVDLCERWEGVG